MRRPHYREDETRIDIVARLPMREMQRYIEMEAEKKTPGCLEVRVRRRARSGKGMRPSQT